MQCVSLGTSTTDDRIATGQVCSLRALPSLAFAMQYLRTQHAVVEKISAAATLTVIPKDTTYLAMVSTAYICQQA